VIPDSRLKNVLQLALAQALMMSVNTLLFTLSAILGYELTETKSLATLPLAIQFCITMLTSFPASMFMDRYGRKAGFILSSFIGFSGTLLAILAVNERSFIVYCLATALFGAYTGFGNYYRFVAAEVSPPEKRNSAISYVLTGGVIAAVVGPNLANHTKDLFSIAYMGSFIAVFILYGLNLMNFSIMDLPKPLNRSIQDYARPLKEIVLQPAYLVALLSATLGYSMMTLLMTATPLAMKHHDMGLGDVAFVIQWHVLGMFVPSFFTGHLMTRFGIERIIFTGTVSIFVAITINLTGSSIWNFWLALLLLGIGWNFMFIGGTTLLTKTYTEVEKAKAQAFNDFTVFSAVTLSSLGAGALQYLLGWWMVNLSVIPCVLICMISIALYDLHKRRETIQNTF
jgi:MFS family permease